MRTRLVIATALLMSIGVTATACHSSGSTSAAGSTNTKNSGGSSANGTKADPCTLVTAAELQTAAGVAVTQSQKGLAINDNACEWQSADGEHSVTVGVFVDVVTPADFAAEAANPVVTKVTGWTYPAYFETNNNFLHALKDNTELLISVVDETTATSNAEILTKEEVLATEAFTKI
jgi:hypothetical protein